MIQGVLVQGTTPEHEFTLPFDTLLIKDLRISYVQKGKEIFVKGLKNCTFSGHTIKTHLTQPETFMFNEKYLIEIQLRLLTKDGEICTNDDDIKLRVKKGFNQEELK